MHDSEKLSVDFLGPVSITGTAQVPIANLVEVVARYRLSGGKIIAYETVLSLIFFSRRASHYAWVADGMSRQTQSVPYSVATALAGIWAPRGLIWSVQAIARNSRGGTDVTHDILAATVNLDLQSIGADIAQRQRAQRNKNLVAVGIVILGVVILTLAALYAS